MLASGNGRQEAAIVSARVPGTVRRWQALQRPHMQREGREPRHALRCYSCGKEGHIAYIGVRIVWSKERGMATTGAIAIAWIGLGRIKVVS